MKYTQYLKQENLLKKLMFKLGVLKQFETIIKIDNTPDIEVVPTDWRDDDNNYYKNSWDYSSYFSNITEFRFRNERVYHFDHIKDAAKELEMHLNCDDIEKSLTLINDVDNRYFQENGWDTDVNESFNFHKVRLLAIDNVKKRIWYDGSFFGNHETYDNFDWGVFSKVFLTGVPLFINEFYLDLLSESYLLYKNQNYKMAYFLAYTTLENYVNRGLGSEESEERLKDKLKNWLKSKYAQLEKHNIYCGIIGEYDEYTQKRNIIAHGKETIIIEKKDAKKILIFVATLLCSFEFGLTTFQELSQELDYASH